MCLRCSQRHLQSVRSNYNTNSVWFKSKPATISFFQCDPINWKPFVLQAMEVTSPSDIGPDDPPAPSKYFKKFPEKNVPGPDQESCQKIFNVYKTHTHTNEYKIYKRNNVYKIRTEDDPRLLTVSAQLYK